MPEVCRSPALKCRILALEISAARQPTTARPVQDRRDADYRWPLTPSAMPDACFVHRAGDDLSPFRIRDVVPRVIAPPGGNALRADQRRQVIWIAPSPQRPTRLAAFPLLTPGLLQAQDADKVAQFSLERRNAVGNSVEIQDQRLNIVALSPRPDRVGPQIAGRAASHAGAPLRNGSAAPVAACGEQQYAAHRHTGQSGSGRRRAGCRGQHAPTGSSGHGSTSFRFLHSSGTLRKHLRALGWSAVPGSAQ